MVVYGATITLSHIVVSYLLIHGCRSQNLPEIVTLTKQSPCGLSHRSVQ